MSPLISSRRAAAPRGFGGLGFHAAARLYVDLARVAAAICRPSVAR